MDIRNFLKKNSLTVTPSWIPTEVIPSAEQKELDALVSKCQRNEEASRKLCRDLKKYCDTMSSLGKAEVAMTGDLSSSSMCQNDPQLCHLVEGYHALAQQALESAATLVTGNNKTVYEPVKRLGVVYSGMNSALKTREDAIAEYQKLNAKIGKLQRLERTGNNVVKQHQYQREANALEQELRERTRHLNGELPQVYGHRVEYFQPCLQAHIFSQVEYYGELVKLFAELVSEEVKGVPGDASKDLLEKVKALSIVA